MRALRPLLFSIFYSTSFTIVFLLTLGFVVVTPADAVRQAWSDGRPRDVGVIAGTYVITGLLAILIYASRIYTTRSVLQNIPKAYIPTDADDLPSKSVRNEIADGLKRNAVVAYEAKPRFDGSLEEPRAARTMTSEVASSERQRNEDQSRWAHIAHPGWSSPASPDIPNLNFTIVVLELPNLIEAKAVSLAPPNPLLISIADDVPIPNEQVVELLQRPLTMGLRDYVNHLDSLGLINPPALAPEFLSLYENARFSTRPLDESSFRDLMSVFAAILQGMNGLDSDLFARIRDGHEDVSRGVENPARHSHLTSAQSWCTPETWSIKSSSTFSVDGTGSIRHHHRRVTDKESQFHIDQRRPSFSDDSGPSLRNGHGDDPTHGRPGQSRTARDDKSVRSA